MRTNEWKFPGMVLTIYLSMWKIGYFEIADLYKHLIFWKKKSPHNNPCLRCSQRSLVPRDDKARGKDDCSR